MENSICITGIKRRPGDRGGRSDLDPGRNINYLLRGGYKVYKVKTYEKIELNIQWKAENVYEVS